MSWLASLLISGLMMTNIGGDPTVDYLQQIVISDDQQTAGQEVERFDQTYQFSPNGHVSLSNLNGSVTVETWDRSEVRVEYTKTGSDKEVMSWVEVKIDASRERIDIEANYDRWKDVNNGNWEKMKGRKLNVAFKLTVPRAAVLDEIETVNGSVVLSNLTNTCKVSTVNGQVKATNVRGNVHLSTVNGAVEADLDQLDSASRFDLETVNGRVMAIIPSDSNATVRADTMNGSIVNDFGLPIKKGQHVGRDLHGQLGSGGASIKLSSVNGQLALTRKQDGRTLSPIKNLLNLSRNGRDAGDPVDGVDVDVDVDAIVEADRARAVSATASINREIERAIRDAAVAMPVVVVDQALNESLREAAKAQKEIVKAQAEAMKASNLGVVLNDQVRNALRIEPSSDTTPSSDKKEETIPVKGMPRVTVEGRNCAVSIKSWDKQEVQYSLTKVSRSTAPGASVTVDKQESRIKIRVSNSSPLNRYWLQIYVPKRSNLKISTDKEIRVEGVSGEIDLNTASEQIDVRDSDGELTALTTTGKIRVIGFTGQATANTNDGVVSLEGEFSKLNANVGDGTLILTVPDNFGAYISTSRETIFGEGVALSKEDDKWKIGNGGETYRIQSSPDGKVIVRNSKRLRAAY